MDRFVSSIFLWIALAVLALMGWVLSASIFMVEEGEHVLVFRGEETKQMIVTQSHEAFLEEIRLDPYLETIQFKSEAGIGFKLPFFERIVRYSAKPQILETSDTVLTTSDHQQVSLIAVIDWQIEHPLTYHLAMGATDSTKGYLSYLIHTALAPLANTLTRSELLDPLQVESEAFQSLMEDLNLQLKAQGIRLNAITLEEFDAKATLPIPAHRS